INTIAGGYFNRLCAFANSSFIGAGQANLSFDSESSILGGVLNNVGDVSTPLQLCCTNTALSFIYLVGNQTTNVLVNDEVFYYHAEDGLVYNGIVTSRTFNAGTNLTCVAGISAGTTNASSGWARNICGSTSSNSTFSSVLGGYANTITNSLVNNAIINGQNNIVSCASYSIIGNGLSNSICSETDTNQSFLILNGICNKICSNQGAIDTILNGCENCIRSCTTSCSNLIANGVCNFIGLCSSYGLIANGKFNKSSGLSTFIGGGTYNNLLDVSFNCSCPILQSGAVIVGGFGHNTTGGTFNTATGEWTTPPTNIIDGSQLSFFGSGINNAITNSSCASVIVNGCLNCISNSCYSFIGSGTSNYIFGSSQHNYSVIVSGGINNISESRFSFIGTGENNTLLKSSCSVIGG
ncbi:hypothetical protein EBU71_21160, partial [bacterium]|nr:hypothetical protein [Candidatus Elulimicrobium humile]